MNIKDDLNFYSLMLDKLSKDGERLRQSISETLSNLSVHSFLIEEQSKTSNEIIKSVKENAEMIRNLNVELLHRRTVLNFISEKITSTKTLVVLFMSFVVIEAFSITPMVLKHVLGW